MFTWLREELRTIKDRRFHILGESGIWHWQEPLADWPVPPPESYRRFIAEFGPVQLYRSYCRMIRVFERPVIVEDAKQGTLLQFGGYDAGMACFRLADLKSGNAQVYETRGVSGLFVTAATFEEWLEGRARKARKLFKKAEWEKIRAGPAPFRAGELEILSARRKFEWKLLDVSREGIMRFEVRNRSSRTIPYLTLDVRGPRLIGRIFLAVADVQPADTSIIGQKGYTHIDEPEKQEAFDAPDPWPEDREWYGEFRSQEQEQ